MALDLSLTHFKKQRGDITIYGTWLFDNDRNRPCMVLLRTNEERHPDAVPFIITVDEAWKWSEDIGEPEYASYQAEQAGRYLRLTDDVRTVLRIVSLVNDHLGELLSIPPFPRQSGTVVADITLTNRDTGKTIEVEMRDDV